MSMNPHEKKSISIVKDGQPKVNENCLKDGQVILQPLAMRIPNIHGVYSPSELSPKKTLSDKEFSSHYANYSISMRVCFDESQSPEELMQRSEIVTAYGFGLDCWYIVVAVESGGDVQEK